MPEKNTPTPEQDRCVKFRAKMGTLTQVIQKTLYERAKNVENNDEKKALLKCHAEVSERLQLVIG